MAQSQELQLRSRALADSIIKISEQISKASGSQAMNYMLSNAYIKALSQLSKPSKNVVMNANLLSPKDVLKEINAMNKKF